MSKEQAQKIQDAVTGTSILIHMQNDPEFLPLKEAIEKNNPWNPEDVTEETLKKHAELQNKMNEIVPRQHLRIIDESLTPEQKKKFNEFHISYMSETEFVFPGMFEALDLSDEQKKQFGEVHKKMEPELDKHINAMIEYRTKDHKKRLEAVRARTTDPDEQTRLINDVNFLVPIWAELQPDRDKKMKSGKELADKLKIEMFDILTDEQWDRMIQLIDNPPEYVKKMKEQQRKWMEEIAKSNANKSGEWQPGPNSWRPGDPIPEQYRQQREERRTRQRQGLPRSESE
jgi:Ni/Co efflux regulator RcnB